MELSRQSWRLRHRCRPLTGSRRSLKNPSKSCCHSSAPLASKYFLASYSACGEGGNSRPCMLASQPLHLLRALFLTNHSELPARTLAQLYRLRWRIELFFRWIKGPLRIKHRFMHQRQCGEDSNLDRGGGLPDGGNPPQGTDVAGQLAPNSADAERSSI